MAITAPPEITPYPQAPQRNQPEAVFVPLANTFAASLEPRRVEMQALADWMKVTGDNIQQEAQGAADAAADAATVQAEQARDDARFAESGAQTAQGLAEGARDAAVSAAASASQYAADAEVFRNESESAKDAALALVNFAGKWADLTGALNTPATAFHQGAYWRLLNDLADVTASEPANDNADWLFIYTNAELRRSLLDEATLYADFENGDYRLYEGVGAGVVRNKAFGDVFTFTRGSSATGRGVSSLEAVTTDVARFVYSPELRKRQGLQIEESRTRLNTVAAAPTVAEDVTVTAVAHTISFYGTGEVVLSGAAAQTLTGTGDDERVELTLTPTAGTLTLTPSGDVVDLQLEVGSVATSVIRGEGSTQTRAADNCSRTLGDVFNPNEFTIIASGSTPNDSSYYLFDANTASTSNRVAILRPGNDQVMDFVTSAATIEGPVIEDGEFLIAALSFSLSKGIQIGSVNGNSFNTPVSEGVAPTNLYVGQRFNGAEIFNGPIGTLFVIPRPLSEAEINVITQPEAQ